METKICTKCGEEKPLDAFNKNRLKKDGLTCYCKECINIYYKIWRQENPEKDRESKRRYDRENPEKERERKRKWRQENPERARLNNVRHNLKKQLNLPIEEIPEELVQYKYLQLKLKHKIKNYETS